MGPDRLAAVAGIREFPRRAAGGLSALQIKAESAARALEDAGLDWADVEDGDEVRVPVFRLDGA